MKSLLNKIINRETISYIFFGALTTLISIASFHLFFYWGFSTLLSNSFSTVLAVTFAYITNKTWVFRSKTDSILRGFIEFFKFCASRAFTYVVETGMLILLIDHLRFNEKYCKILSSGIIIVMNYLLSKKAVFKNR